MILSSWLTAVFRRLKQTSIRSRGRTGVRVRKSVSSASPMMVETLEPRQLLTNPAVVSATVNFTANSEIFPYGQNSVANGTVVATVTVIDPDLSPNDYSPGNLQITAGNNDVNGNGSLPFAIRPGTNQIIVNDTRDLYLYSGVTSFQLTIVATDNSNATGTGIITINLQTPLNQRPVVPQYNYPAIDNLPAGSVNVLQVNENSFAGTEVGTVTAIDPDSGDQRTLTYAFTGTVPGFDASTPAFAIDPFTGKITVLDPTFLDYEARRQNIGSVVGDLGEGGLSGYADVVFDCRVIVTDNRGFNSLTSHTDQDNNSNTTSDIAASHVYIRLRDVGETPPNVTNSTKSMNVNENSPKNLSVGFFDLIDGTPNFVNGPPRTAKAGLDTTEPQQTHSFAIVGGNPNNTFAIDYTTGEITVNNPVINYETLNVYNLQIAVTDENSAAVALGAVDNVAPLTTVATLHITVNDINEVTTIPSGQNFSIPENTVNGTVVGTVVANDPDTQRPNGQAVLVYSIISGNTVKVNNVNYPNPQPDPGVGVFTIDPSTGVISVNNQTLLAQNVALNFENQPQFSLTVRVVDRGDLSTSANSTVVINLSNVNETPPSFTDTTFTIAENRPLNTLVGKVTAAVGEIGNSIIGYQITAGNTNGAFAIDNLGNITVANPAMINYETNQQFVLTVKATDNGSPALIATATVTINITNLNEQIVMLDQSFTVNENTPNGIVVGQIITSDPDNIVSQVQGTHFVITSGNTGGAFAIDDQGRVTVSNVAALNFEVNPSFSLIVTVNDTGVTAVPTTSTSATMTISLINVNDAPVIGSQAFNVKEHSLAGTVVGTVQATDADRPAQTLTYAIIGGDPTNAFTINSATGAITVNDPHLIDYLTTPVFNLNVQVTDNGVPPMSSSAIVQILLQSLSAPHIVNQTVTFPENTANGTFIAAVAATGGVAPYIYSIIGGNTNNAFSIAPGTGAFVGMGVITVNDVTQLNYETIKTFGLRVLVKDSQATPLGDTATITVNLTNVNEPPILSGIESSPLNWNENTPPSYVTNNVTPVTASLLVTDTDGATQNLSGATIQITGNYQYGEDQLVFTNTPNITGSWNALTGKLTLSGVDTQANYTAALRSVSYTDTSNAPNTLKRTVTYQVFDDGTDGVNPPGAPLPSNTTTRDINIVPVNDPPTLSSIEVGALNWVENTPPNYATNNVTQITATIATADPDSINLTGATVQITGNYQSTEDQLIFTSTPKITGTWDSTTGKLTLTGTDTLANYQSALRSVAYTDISNAPNTLKRTVTFQVTDDGALLSNTVSRDITITPVNDPPTLSAIEGNALNWIENTPPAYATNNVTPITATLVAGDPDSATLTGATVQITGNYQSSEDRLIFTNTANIAGTFDSITGTLTLSGTDTLANYTAALRSVSFTDLSNAPITLKRTVTYQVSDAGPLLSNTITRDINITPVNDPPVLSAIEGSALNWIENTPPNYASNNVTPVTATLIAADPDSVNLTGATIQITGNYQSTEDQLVFINTASITGVWNVATGTLTLTGTDTLANYTAALRAVSFTNTSNAPNTLKRTVTYQVSDGGPLVSNSVTRDINITPVNDPPTLSGIEVSALTWSENTPPNYASNNVTPVTGTLVTGDPDSTVLSGATVQITGNYRSSEDRLLFTNTATITGTFDIASGILTLTGTDTLANYTAALRSVAYTDLSDAPNTLKRTVTYQIADDGPLLSNTVTRDINIAPVNDPPVLSAIEGSPLNWIESTPPAYSPNNSTPITASLLASDPDSVNLTGATVRITGNYRSNEDRLIFTNTAQITGVFDIPSGTLTLTGTDTVANYTAALRSVAYLDRFDAPNTQTRTVTYQVRDDGSLLSNTVTRDINITPVNDPPVLIGLETAAVNCLEKATTQVTAGIVATDPDSNNAMSATITFAANYVSGQDTLVFTNTPTITGVFNPVTGTLTLSGVDSLSNYRTALRSVGYFNLSNNPSSVTRTLGFQITDDSGLSSAIVYRDVNVIPVNDPPVLASSLSVLNYTEGTGAQAINPFTTVNDPDSLTLVSAVITLTAYLSNQDVLGFVNDGATMGNIAIQSNVGGVLQLTSVGGTATLAQWQAAFDAVTYTNTSQNPTVTTRTVTFVANDGASANQFSNALTTLITVIPVNNPPILTNPSNVTYTENDVPLAIDIGIGVSDPDNTTFPGGVVTITNFVAGEDQISFTNDGVTMGNIAVQSNTNGQLTLVSAGASATAAQWQAAFAAVTYFNSSDNPSNATRNVTFVLSDGALDSNLLACTVDVRPVNDAPVLSGIESTVLQYFENTPPNFTTNNTTRISASIAAADPDSLLTSATIQITGNYVAGEDFLRFKDTPTIKGSYNTTTGTMTLTGVDTVANYMTALQSVGFFDRSDTPSTLTRTVSFTVTDDGGSSGTPKLNSNTVTRNIAVNAVNDPPVLFNNLDIAPLVYTEDAPPLPVLPNFAVTDADSNNLTSATIRISAGYNANGSLDRLVFTNTTKISGSWDAATGVLTLTGTDSLSNYRSALRTVAFANQNDGVTTPPRTVTFSAIDETGVVGNPVSRDIVITTHPNAAILSGIETTTTVFKANDPFTPPTPITSTLVLTDFDSVNQTSAVVTISNNYVRSEDQLVIDGSVLAANKLTASWNSANGQLTLSGLASLLNYQNALQAVKFVDSSTTPSTATRTITFQTFDDTPGMPLPSNIVSRLVSISTVNVASVVATNAASALQYVEKDSATVIAPGLTVTDVDSPNLNGASIRITSNYVALQDKLVFVDTAKIKGSFDAASGTLTLAGLDTQANYQAALRTVQYLNTSNNPSALTRTVSFSVNDGLTNSNTSTRNITVTPVNDGPVVAVNQGDLSYSASTSGAVFISPSFTVVDPDSNFATSARIQIASNYERGKDALTFVTIGKISGVFDVASGILTLTGTDTFSNYRAAIQSIKYQYTGNSVPSSKMIEFSVSDGIAFSNIVSRKINLIP